MPAFRFFLPLLALLILSPVHVHGQSRLLRRFAEEAGLVPPVWAVGQDSDGFLWIGAQGGLFRYDGSMVQPWPTGPVKSGVISMDFHEDGRVAAVFEQGQILEVQRGTVRHLRPPGPPGPRMLRMVAYDRAGSLWTIRGNALFRRDYGGAWRRVAESALEGERPLMVRRDNEGAVLVSTNRGVWRIAIEGRGRKVIEAPGIVDMVALGKRVLALSSSGHLLQIDSATDAVDTFWIPGAADKVRGARPVALAQRGGTLWLAFDRFLVAVRPDRALEVLSSRDGIDAGGPLFVDREGSLWLGTFAALLQLPEPETRVWTELQGLPSRHLRFLARTGQTVWVSGWQGVARLDAEASGIVASAVTDWFSQQRFCKEPVSGRIWASSGRDYLELTDIGVVRVHPIPGVILGCAPSSSGGLWIASSGGLLHVKRTGDMPERVSAPQLDSASDGWEAVLEDRRGRLWLARRGRICVKPLNPDRDWRCRAVGETGKITGLLELPSGAIWASTMQSGVLRLTEDGQWEVLPASHNLPSTAIFGLIPSPTGGVWIIGHGIVQRVLERGDGWTVAERLGAWNGLPATGGEDLLEDEDRTVWITSSLGLIEVPPRARFAPADPPPVALVEAAVDGQKVSASELVNLPYQQNRLELRFAALSFRDPGLVRYQIRLPQSDPWREARGSPSFRWFDLRPGRYSAQFRASLDGLRWSPEPSSVQFRVRSPWYLEPGFIAALVLLLAAAALLIHRTRVRILLGLERQRTRIAMDLHDEIGSGLGSIGILAGAVTDSTSAPADAAADRGRQLAGQIARTSEELGEALSDIVWALDPKTASLQELAARLSEHGNRLCSAEDSAEFVTDFPTDWPTDELSLSVRRNVLSIGLEALHNAARHADAQRVVLSLRPLHQTWELSVEDNGCGTSCTDGENGAVSSRNGGRGLAGMRKRAQEIGAQLTMGAANGSGTRVQLRFRPR